MIAAVLFSGLLLLHPTEKLAKSVVPAEVSKRTELAPQPAKLISPVTVPVYKGVQPVGQDMASMSASAVYVMDRESGAILYQKNASAPRYPASTAKMMTAIVARQVYSLDRVLTVKEAAFTTGTVVGLKLGEQISVENLLKALLIPSGNDAALVLGENHPFGYQGFIAQMNQEAKQLHLTQTVYNNVSGLDADNELSTARDLAILANELMKDPILREIVGIKQTEIRDDSGKTVHYLRSTHDLLGYLPGVVGIKTGTTEFAGENLITQVDRDGHQVIIVMMGSEDRFGETTQLINWIFSHYEWQTIDNN